MPITFTILPPSNLIVLRPTGRVNQTEFADYFRDVRAHPDYVLGLDRLVDSRQMEALELDFDQMRSLRAKEISFIARAPRRVRTAFLTGNDDGHAMARMYQSLVEANDDHEVGLFHALDRAMAFLGLDPDVLQESLEGKPG